MPVRIHDRKSALQDILIDLLKREQVFTHLINKGSACFCRQEGNIDRISSEYIHPVRAFCRKSCVVWKVIGVREYRTIRIISEFLLQPECRECSRESYYNLIPVKMPLQKLRISFVRERRRYDTDITAAVYCFCNIIRHHVELCRPLYNAVADDRLRLEYLLHSVLKLRHLIHIYRMPL